MSKSRTFAGLLDVAPVIPSLVAFPATQVANADPNTLDDYEEGLVSPAPSFTFATVGNLSVAYSSSPTPYSKYTKVGNRVFVHLDIRATTFTWTTSSGQFSILNAVPFAPADTIFIPLVYDGGTWNITGSPSGIIQAGTTTLQLEFVSNTTGQRSIINHGSAPSGSMKSVFANFSYTV